MEGTGDLVSRLERAELQLKSLQRTCRTTLQVIADLREQIGAHAEELDAQPKEGTANGYSYSTTRSG